MYWFFGFLVLWLPIFANGTFRIVGGDITDISKIPYQASLYDEIQLCGGTIISTGSVITAAHCFKPDNPEENLSITVGSNSYQPNNGGTTYKAKKVYIHEGYIEVTLVNDIAIVYIDGEFVYSDSVKPAELPKQDDFLEKGTIGRVSGWGTDRDKSNTPSEELKATYIKVTDMETCDRTANRVHRKTNIKDSYFCAAEDNFESNICSGDSGGGFVTDDNVVHGIVSWSLACGEQRKPSGFTRIAYYLNFIADTYVKSYLE